MSLTLYSHPFSSYSQKVLIALYENDTPFTYRNLEEPGANEERQALWPTGKFPVLVDNGRTVVESSIIIEHLDLHHRGPTRFLPDDPVEAKPELRARQPDRAPGFAPPRPDPLPPRRPGSGAGSPLHGPCL